MIKTLLNSGRRYDSDRLTIYQDKNTPGLNDDYGAVYIVNKSAGGAVRRNRIRRWLRGDLRQFQKKHTLNGGYVIRFKGRTDNVTHHHLSEEFGKLYEAIRINA